MKNINVLKLLIFHFIFLLFPIFTRLCLEYNEDCWRRRKDKDEEEEEG